MGAEGIGSSSHHLGAPALSNYLYKLVHIVSAIKELALTLTVSVGIFPSIMSLPHCDNDTVIEGPLSHLFPLTCSSFTDIEGRSWIPPNCRHESFVLARSWFFWAISFQGSDCSMEPSNALKAIAVLNSCSQSMIPTASAFISHGNSKNEDYQIPPRTTKSETVGWGFPISSLTSPPGDSDAHSNLRTTGLHIRVETYP